jgi:hypothetical protein
MAEYIPENNDFCAVSYMNPDIDTILGCFSMGYD